MSQNRYTGTIFLCAFFVIVLVVAFTHNPHYPSQVISGEASVATWLSGTLLVLCSALSLVFGIQQQKGEWYAITAFFLLLAADERFMFHEQIKAYLIFADHTRSRWVFELPVLVGAGVGVIAAVRLWYLMQGTNRVLLLCAVLLGALSTGMDVMKAGVLLEDSFKLLGELALACALILSSGRRQ